MSSQLESILKAKIIINETNFTFSMMSDQELKEFSKNHGSHLESILKQRYGKSMRFIINGIKNHSSGIYVSGRRFKSL